MAEENSFIDPETVGVLEELRLLKIHEFKEPPEGLTQEMVDRQTALYSSAKVALESPSKPSEAPNGGKVHYQYYEDAAGTGGLPAVICTCGWSKHHLRLKVLGRASEKHWLKTGHNTKPQKG